MYPQEDLAVLRRIIELQDRTTIPYSERVYAERRENRADGSEVLFCMGSTAQETAREHRAAWSDEIARVNLDIHRTDWTPVREPTSDQFCQTPRAEPAPADLAKRRELLLRLRNLDGLVEYATIAPQGEWFNSLDAIARQIHITTQQLVTLGFFVRATLKGRSIARGPVPTAGPDHTSSELLPPIVELLTLLRQSKDPVAMRDLPPHLVNEDVLNVASQRGFIMTLGGRSIDLTTRTETPGPACVMLTPAGAAFASEMRLRERTPAAPAARTYIISEVLDMAGISDTTLNQYAKRAGVSTPGRGKRNHRYNVDEVRAILQTIIDQTSDRDMKARCRAALNRLDI